jgi:hypothetical protein
MMSALPPIADIALHRSECPLCAKSGPSAMQQKERFLAAVLLWQLSELFQTRFERGEKARCFTSGDGAMIEGER